MFSRRVILTLAVILVIIVVGMVMTVRRAGKQMRAADPDDISHTARPRPAPTPPH